MGKKILLFLSFLALLASANEYEIDHQLLQNRIFFAKSAAEKTELFRRVKFINSLAELKNVFVAVCPWQPRWRIDAPTDQKAPGTEINELSIFEASQHHAEVIAGSLNRTSIRQVLFAQKSGYKVCLMPAKNLNDLVAGLLKKPDYILCDAKLDLDKVEKILAEDHSGKITPVLPLADLNDRKNCKLNYSTAAQRSEGTTLRVMSYNILGQCFDEARLASVRANGIIQVLQHLAPDIAGIQEVDLNWYANLDTGCLAPLEFIHQDISPYPPSIALLYNAEKFKVTAKGFIPFTDQWIRALSWAVLENLADGKRFIATNTHWALNVPARLKNAALMAKSLNRLKQEYNCPVISFGDFNCRSNSEEYALFLKKSGMNDAMESAPLTENRGITSYCLFKYFHVPQIGDAQQIDHVAYSPDLMPISARIVLDEKLLDLSDHLPLVVDFKY